MKDDESTPVQIERPIYNIEELNREHLYQKPYSTRKYIFGKFSIKFILVFFLFLI